MARFLATCWPDSGHFSPQLGIAVALRERGHQVAFYTAPERAAAIGAEGLTLFPFEHNVSFPEQVLAEARRASTGWWTPRLALSVMRERLAASIPKQVADLERLIHRWQPDVIVNDITMWAPMLILREAFQLPVALASFHIEAAFIGPEASPLVPGIPRFLSMPLWQLYDVGRTVLMGRHRHEVNRIRASYGLPPVGLSLEPFIANLPLQIVPSLPELDNNRRDLPPSVQYVGSCDWRGKTDDGPPDWLASLPRGQPVVHVTEGTAHFQDPFLIRAAIEGLANQPLQAIISTGPQRDMPNIVSTAPNIRVERWINYDHLLPRCSAVVTTGGPGTIRAALQAGVPLVVVPTSWEHPRNAQRIVNAGLGVRLKPAECTPVALRRAIGEVISNPIFRSNAGRIARRFAQAGGAARAAELLEQLAGSRGCSAAGSRAAV